VESVAFPAISCGVYGFPVEEAAPIALAAARASDLPVIRFVNKDVDPHTITIWNKPGAGAETDADLEAKTLTIQPQSLYEHGPMVLAAGRRVAVAADIANMISCRPHGWDIS